MKLPVTTSRHALWLLMGASFLACDGTEPIVGHVQGTVTVEGEPMASIAVTLASDTVRTGFTDAAGRFRFEVGDGAYTVTVAGTPVEASFDALTRAASLTTTGQVVQVDFRGEWIRTSVISGVILANDAPVPDMGVAVSGPSTAQTRTDAQGAFRIEALRAGTYHVSLTDFAGERFQFAETTLEAVAGVGGTAELGFHAQLLPPAAPTGVTVEEDGPYRIVVTWQDVSEYEAEYRLSRRIEDQEWVDLKALEPDATGFVDEDLVPGTRYGYRARACNEIGCSEEGVEAEARTEQIPPAAPGQFAASAINAFQINLTWTDESFNEAGFHLERRLGDQGEWSEVVIVGEGTTSYADEGRTADTEYGYRMRSCNEVGCSEYVGPVEVITPELPPETPGTLAAVSAGASQVDLTWLDLSDNETRFSIERQSGASGWVGIADVPAGTSSHSDLGLTPGTLFNYRILACNDGGCSPPSNQASATTDQTPPPAPSALSATATQPDRVELTWQYGGSNETGLHVERRVKNQGNFAEIVTLPPGSSAHADQGVETGKTFQYRVRSCNSVGCSSFSNVAEATTVTPPQNNLQVAAVHVTQVIQSLGGGVPLVEGKGGLLRVFVTTGLANGFQPDVRIRLFDGATMIQETLVSAPTGSVPLAVDESELTASWNLPLSGAQIKPGLGIQIDVDPGDVVAETNESDNRYPAAGTQTMDVRVTDPMSIVFVPVLQSVNGLEGSASPGNYTATAQALFPASSVGGSARATYVTDAPELQSNNGNGAWGTILSEIAALRAADGSSSQYYGAVQVSYGGGVAGMGYVGAPIAIGWDKGGAAGIAAHEWGHNFGRRHAPCGGAGNPDASFPYSDGSIGVWGYNGSALRSPATYKDLMGYCGPDWISDYTYTAILSQVQSSPSPPAVASADPVDGLLVWGRIDQAGVVLEPSFHVRAPVQMPTASGPYRIRGFDAAGTQVLDFSFSGLELPEEAGPGRHFAFVVPRSALAGRDLAELRLDGPGVSGTRIASPAPVGGDVQAIEPSAHAVSGGNVEVNWNPALHPMALVRDPASGEVISFARTGRVTVPLQGGVVEVLLSNGLSSERRSLPVR